MPHRVLSIFVLTAMLTCTAAALGDDTPVVHFTADPTREVHPISRCIYGVNHVLSGEYDHLPFERLGGNRWTAYNWINNASNAGNDWHYQNDGFLGGGGTPGGAVAGPIENASAHEAGILITVPINGYVSADKTGEGDIRLSGPDYLAKRLRPEKPTCPRPFSLHPADDSVVYQDEFVNWVEQSFPYCRTDPQRPIYFSLDNEPDIWASTHPEVHPAKLTYAELVEKSIAYATAIKAVAPRSLVFGPANYGWGGYGNLQGAPDARGRDFQEFYLAEMARAEKSAGHRLLDVLDVHWYSEARGDGRSIEGDDHSPAVTAARVQAPRSLWDPTYVESSWITRDDLHGPIRLIPRLQAKIARSYPATLLAITEYSYGGGQDISGAIAEADALGIFGKTGVFAACQWPLTEKQPFIAAALNLYRNLDGHGTAFGDCSVFASTDNPVDTSFYASTSSAAPHDLILMAINKTDHDLSAEIQLEHARRFKSGKVFSLTSAGTVPQSGPPVKPAEHDKLLVTLPAMSVSAIRLSGGDG